MMKGGSQVGGPTVSWSKSIRGFLFDLGDTLIPAGKLQRETLKAVVERLDHDGWLAAGRPFISTYVRVDADPVFDEIADLNHLYSDARIVSATFETMGVRGAESDVQRFLRKYRCALRRRIKPDRAWKGALEVLRSRGLRLGIVSNGTTVEQYDQLERLDLRPYFDPVLISQEVGIRKPSPAIFLMGAQYWGLDPSEIAVVGDRPDWETHAAQRAGMKSILTVQYVDHRQRASPGSTPDAIIHGPGDLIALVEAGHEGIAFE